MKGCKSSPLGNAVYQNLDEMHPRSDLRKCTLGSLYCSAAKQPPLRGFNSSVYKNMPRLEKYHPPAWAQNRNYFHLFQPDLTFTFHFPKTNSDPLSRWPVSLWYRNNDMSTQTTGSGPGFAMVTSGRSLLSLLNFRLRFIFSYFR